MRKLMIRFKKEGELFREIDEERNYFISEAEEIVHKIRERLESEKRIVEPKPYECWIDGQRLIITHVAFDNNVSLTRQLEETMLGYDAWEHDVKHKYINLLKDYTKEEKILFTNEEFKVFAIRFDQVLGRPDRKPGPFVLDITKLKQLFDGVITHVETGFYSEIEEIMNAINTGYQAVVNIVNNEIVLNSGSQNDKNVFVEVRVKTWLGNEENFQRFISHVAASYQSVSKNRIETLCPSFGSFQEMEKFLFEEFVQKIGFVEVYKLHKKMVQALYEKFDKILFNGFAIKTDDMVLSLVLKPVIDKFWSKIYEQSSSGKEMANANERVTVS